MSKPNIDIADVLERSVSQHKAGDVDSARAGYLEVLREAPEHPAALNLLGTLDAQLGNLVDAERLLRKAISHAPREGAYYTNLAGILQQAGRHTEAVQAYRLALRIDPGQPEVLNNFGALLLESGQVEEAEGCFRKVLELRPEAPEVHNNLGRALNNQRRFEEALLAFSRAVQLDPNFARAYNNLGHVYRALGRNTHAAASFQQAITLDENLADAYRNLGTVYLAQNMPEEAVECLEEAARRHPDNAGTYIDLGVAQHGLGRLDEAVSAYRKAVACDADNPYAYLNLGLVLVERRNLKAAETAFNQALALKPDLIDAAAELAGILDELGRLDELEQVIDKGLSIDPGHVRLNLEAARLERRRGKIAAAIARLQAFDLQALNPRLAQQLRYELGRLHDRAGEPELAWLHSKEANQLAASGWRAYKLDAQRVPKRLKALRKFYTNTDFASLPSYEAEADAPVFLVGFPAAGSDFVAEALAAHPGIQVLDEAPTLSAIEQELTALPEGYPAALATLGAEALSEYRALYWQLAERLLKREPTALLVDHHPMRAIHAGLMLRLFPNTRLIYLQRHPADLCLANFMQNYALNDMNAQFLDFVTTIEALAGSVDTWQAARKALQPAVHVVRFESLAADAEAELGAVLEFIGVEKDGSTDTFLEEVRAGKRITRSSYRQLADPLDPHMCGRWRDYRRELSRYMDKLMPLAEAQGYDFDQ